MNPEVWMPFYGQDFDRSTKGWPRQVKWSYFACIWSYWCGECAGLMDNEDVIRGICECDPQEWAITRGFIFGEKFQLRDGKWHNKRAGELYVDAVNVMRAAHNRALTGARVRWQSSSNAQAMLKQSSADAPSPSESESYTESESPSQKDVGRVAKATPASRLTDEAWISSLTANEAYAGIDVKKEFAKMTAWCAVNRKQPSRRRFVNWLNRAERPIAAPSLPVARFGPPMGDVVALAKEKWPQDNRSANWGVSFWKYWEKRGWKRANGDSIDWKVEFSKQVSAWRTTSEQPSKIL